MTSPIIVSAVEESFVPLLIHNNSLGEDAKVLRQFKEPAWNYQVIRFLNSKGKDIIPRKDKVWTKAALIPRMVQSLKKAKRPVPNYLSTAALAADTTQHRQVALAMYCFWTGEMKLGQIEGVLRTEAGWLDGHEVTLVTYHANKISLPKLLAKAQRINCANKVYLATQAERSLASKSGRLSVGTLDNSYRKAKSSDQKRQVSRLKLPKSLTAEQRTKFNAWYHADRKKAFSYLTASQRAAL